MRIDKLNPTTVFWSAVTLAFAAGALGVSGGGTIAYASDAADISLEIIDGEDTAVSYLGNYEGFNTVSEWEQAQRAHLAVARDILSSSIDKMNSAQMLDWSVAKGEAASLLQDINASWNVETANAAVEKAQMLDQHVMAAIKSHNDGVAIRHKAIADEAKRIDREEAKRKAADEEAAQRAAEEEAAREAEAFSQEPYASYDSSSDEELSSSTYSGNADLESFKQQGVIYDNGYRYTYYSESVLPGGGLDIPGRGHTNGFVTDGDGYISVASSDLPWGTVVETPFGPGKVYDSGCASGTIDIYIE